MSSTTSFEVMHYKDGHWTIAFVTSDKEEAMSEAKVAEQGRHVQAVKVVQQATDEDTGEEVSRTIYSGRGQHEEAPKGGAHPQSAAAAKGTKGADAEPVTGKKELHPEKVTGFIDKITKSVGVVGGIAFLFVILALLYVSNPDAISNFLDSLLK